VLRDIVSDIVSVSKVQLETFQQKEMYFAADLKNLFMRERHEICVYCLACEGVGTHSNRRSQATRSAIVCCFRTLPACYGVGPASVPHHITWLGLLWLCKHRRVSLVHSISFSNSRRWRLFYWLLICVHVDQAAIL